MKINETQRRFVFLLGNLGLFEFVRGWIGLICRNEKKTIGNQVFFVEELVLRFELLDELDLKIIEQMFDEFDEQKFDRTFSWISCSSCSIVDLFCLFSSSDLINFSFNRSNSFFNSLFCFCKHVCWLFSSLNSD